MVSIVIQYYGHPRLQPTLENVKVQKTREIGISVKKMFGPKPNLPKLSYSNLTIIKKFIYIFL